MKFTIQEFEDCLYYTIMRPKFGEALNSVKIDNTHENRQALVDYIYDSTMESLISQKIKQTIGDLGILRVKDEDRIVEAVSEILSEDIKRRTKQVTDKIKIEVTPDPDDDKKLNLTISGPRDIMEEMYGDELLQEI